MGRGPGCGILSAFALTFLLALAPVAHARDMMPGPSRADVIAADLPAVVNVSVVKVRPAQPRVADAASAGPPARQFRVHAFGSGFVIDPSGVIVTNRHVIDNAVEISVGFQDKTRAPAQVIAASSGCDVALLKVDVGHKLPALAFADSNKVRIGDPVVAIGNPLGIGTSVSAGIVSALNRDIHDSPFDDFIQSDAAINHGNSGGPLIDAEGQVIGINTAIYSNVENGGSIGLGFAIASNDASFVIARLRRYGHVRAGWIGVEAQDVNAGIALAEKLPAVQGAIVTGLSSAGGPAAKAGLTEGDVILSLDGKPVSDARALMRSVAILPLDSEVTVGVLRDGHHLEIRMPVAEYPDNVPLNGSMKMAAAGEMRMVPPDLGLHISPITEKARQTYALPADATGVVVTGIDDNSPAADLGIAPGSLILRVGDVKVGSAGDVQRGLDEARRKASDSLLLLVDTKGDRRWVALMLAAG